MLLRLKADVRWLNGATKISGAIKGASDAESVVAVALVRPGEQHDYIPETYTVRYGKGPFKLLNREGSFYLIAFEDQNEDLRLSMSLMRWQWLHTAWVAWWHAILSIATLLKEAELQCSN